jgi:acetyltransferase-like isoleucine patch superfamily enzyme
MIRDHRPYRVKKAYLRLQAFYVEHFLRPQFVSLGHGYTFMKPWHVEIFGSPIELGEHANVIATSDKKIRLTVWSDREDRRGIRVGDYCLICPGVRMSSATEIVVGDNCMIASGAYITDSDWHDIYNRVAIIGKTGPVRIEDNVWIGDSAIVCKGVTLGQNCIVGAGAVVVDSVPANAIAAGNPARVVKHLDPSMKLTTRAHWFADPVTLSQEIDQLDREKLQGNSVFDWMRSWLFPEEGD